MPSSKTTRISKHLTALPRSKDWTESSGVCQFSMQTRAGCKVICVHRPSSTTRTATVQNDTNIQCPQTWSTALMNHKMLITCLRRRSREDCQRCPRSIRLIVCTKKWEASIRTCMFQLNSYGSRSACKSSSIWCVMQAPPARHWRI